MINAPIALAFTAGMVATFNPCGFSLLPAYVSAFVVGDDTSDRVERRLLRAVGSAAAVSIGLVLVFATAGILIDSVTGEVRRQLPWVTITIGVLLVVAGIATMVGWKPNLAIRAPSLSRERSQVAVMIGYGVTYAVASLSCTIGPFLAVTGAALTQSAVGGTATYLAYALGMGLVILTISVTSALAHTTITRHMRRISASITRIGGLLMVVAGGYVVWYGRWELAVYRGESATGPLIDAMESVRMWFVGLFDTVGSGLLVAAVVVGISGLLLWRTRVARPVLAGEQPAEKSSELNMSLKRK